jgi:hypothetical protein
MSYVDDAETTVKKWWMDYYDGPIDNNNEEYMVIKRWAMKTAISGRKPVTYEMVDKKFGKKAAAAPAMSPSPSTEPKKSTGPKKDEIKASMAHVYKLCEMKDGRSKVPDVHVDVYKPLSEWVRDQVCFDMDIDHDYPSPYPNVY